MRSRLAGSLAGLGAFFYSCVATADTVAVAPTGVQPFTDQVMAILTPVFVLLIGTLVTWILTKLKDRLHLDVSEKLAAQWDNLARLAALRGAEWAQKEAKKVVGGKVPGSSVMEVAVGWALQMAAARDLPPIEGPKLEGLIEANVFKLRIENSALEQTAVGTVATNPTPKI